AVTKTAPATVAHGGDVTFTIRIDNLSSTPLHDVAVEDLATPDCDRTFADLPGAPAFVEYQCTATGVTDDFVNVAQVTALDPLDAEHAGSGSAAVDALTPSIALTKV